MKLNEQMPRSLSAHSFGLKTLILIKSMGKYSNAPYLKERNLISLVSSESWYLCQLLITQVQFLICDPCKGHLRLPQVTFAFLQITLDRGEIGMCERHHCDCLAMTHQLICDIESLDN